MEKANNLILLIEFRLNNAMSDRENLMIEDEILQRHNESNPKLYVLEFRYTDDLFVYDSRYLAPSRSHVTGYLYKEKKVNHYLILLRLLVLSLELKRNAEMTI